MSGGSPEQRLRRWLLDEGYFLGEVKVQASRAPSWSFSLAFSPDPSNQQQQKINFVVVGNDELEKATVVVRANFSPEHARTINSSGVLAKAAITRLRERFFLHNIGFALLADQPTSGPAPKFAGLSLDQLLYYDAPLTRDLFMGTLRKLYGAFLFAVDVLTQATNPTGFEPSE
ncbi:MAG: hypothetical protein HYT80_05805 [Euryarchaeota archaeon]|nr:hypothetical protein [Euryarchaeota archaeon]